MKTTALVTALLVLSMVPAGGENLCVLIDTGHGGYLLKEDRLSEFRNLARNNGFSVELKSIGRVSLDKYTLVISANPDTPFSPNECLRLKDYLNQGGTFFLMGAGDYENRDHSDVTNPVLEALGSDIQFCDDQLYDIINSGKSYIPIFDAWRPHPLTKNLPPISVYSPESVVCGERGYPLLQGNKTTESRDTDGTILHHVPSQTVTILAVERIGRGNLLVGGSSDFVKGLAFTGHTEFAERLLHYLSEIQPTIPNYARVFHGASIIIGETCRPEVDRKTAESLSLIVEGRIVRENGSIIIGGPHVNPSFSEINKYLPIPFREHGTWYITRNRIPFHGQEYGIIAVITVNNTPLLVIAGLGGTGTAGAFKTLETVDLHTLVYTYNNYGEAVLISVSGDSNLNGVEEESESWSISIL